MDDEQQLRESLMSFASFMLARHGEFYPHGAGISASGQLTSIGGHIGEEHPNPRELAQFLVAALRQSVKDGQYRSTGLAANVDVPADLKPSAPDGVRITVESPAGARATYVPYQLKRRFLPWPTRYRVTFFEPITVDVHPLVFVEA